MIFRHIIIKEMTKFLGSIIFGVGFGIGFPIGVRLYLGGSFKDIKNLPPTTEISLKDFKKFPPTTEV